MIIIEFIKKTLYKGRNRVSTAKGLEILLTQGGTQFMISPINKQGASEACWIEIPIADIDKVIDALKKTKEAAKA